MSTHLTPAEVEASLAGISKQIARYAKLAIRSGVALKPGQELVVSCAIEQAGFARLLVQKAYELGAGHVTVIWHDDEVERLEYHHNDVEFFATTPSWKREQLDSLAAQGAAFLFVTGSDPRALEGIDSAKIATARRARAEQCRIYREGLDYGKNAWTIVGAPVLPWARAVFPQAHDDEAMLYLWQAILMASRADGRDPQAEWERHNASFEKEKRLLNGWGFDRLRYRSSNGTDLTIGLNKGHIWMGGAAQTVDGTVFFPNIPTEEVFNSPDRMRAEGVVYGVMPLVYGCNVIRDFWLRFEAGRVVAYDAAEGRDVLRSILQTDQNSCRLGECALVAKDTPIRRSGLLFYDTLYDENASCHLALGNGFPECLTGGHRMDREQLMAHGVNQSHTHVDFMIGADDLEVTGITQSDEEIPVFIDGRWAWSL